MAIANLIARGIGFSPGSVEFIVTHGLGVGEAVATAIVGIVPVRRWYIYPDGRRLHQTIQEARDTLDDYLRRKKRRRPEKVKRAIRQSIEKQEETAIIASPEFLKNLDLPSIPEIVFDFAPPPIDNTALEMILLRMQGAQLQLEAQRAMVLARRKEEEALLTLLLA